MNTRTSASRAPRDAAARAELAELEEELATVRRRILKAEARAETARRELAERVED